MTLGPKDLRDSFKILMQAQTILGVLLSNPLISSSVTSSCFSISMYIIIMSTASSLVFTLGDVRHLVMIPEMISEATFPETAGDDNSTKAKTAAKPFS